MKAVSGPASAGNTPLIAVTTSEIRDGRDASRTPQSEPARPEMLLGLRYLKAIEEAVAVPVVVPPIHDEALLSALLDRVSGVCLTGGPDLDPVSYGALPHAQLGPTWRELDAYELALARLADNRGLPILAICRGLQTINVSRGGTLHQHLPEHVGGGINHRQTEPPEQTTHSVSLTESSQVADILGARSVRVNSFHHQAADRIGRGLVVTGHANDGTIEGLEASDREFLIAVQWHAECLTGDPAQRALFRAFTDAARRYGHNAEDLRPAA